MANTVYAHQVLLDGLAGKFIRICPLDSLGLFTSEIALQPAGDFLAVSTKNPHPGETCQGYNFPLFMAFQRSQTKDILIM